MRAIWVTVGLCVVTAGCSGPAEREGEGEERGAPGGVVFRWAQRLDEYGEIAPGVIPLALAQREALVAAQGEGNPGPSSWTWLGPGNIGGRIRPILIHPTQPNTMWVGAVTGGVWKTTNAGASWSPLDGFLTSITIGCMALDPTNPDLLYAGTGEGFFNSIPGTSNTTAVPGAGIFVSTDGGTNWSHLASTSGPDWAYVNRIAIQPGNSQVLLAATGGGIYRSTNGGTTWSQRTTTRTLDVDFHPTDGTQAVAGRSNGIAQYSLDGGVTWTNATGITNSTRVELAYSKSNPTTVYGTIAESGGGVKVWRSTNGGQSYVLQTTGAGTSTLSLYTGVIWVHPTNPNFVLFGGQALRRSTNAGVSHSSISSGLHADHHTIVEHPGFNGTTNRTVYSANDGGIYVTTDIEASTVVWQELNNQLGITQFYGAAMNPTTGIMIGGTQDNGTKRFSGGTETWTTTFGGDGGFCAADPTDPDYFYGETQFLNIFRSTNAGVSGSSIAGGINDLGPNFIPFLMLDPNDPNRMLAAGRALWRSNNVKAGTPTWTSIKAPQTCVIAGVPEPSHYNDNPPCNISTIAVAQGNSDVVWVGHNNGDIFKTTNGTAGVPVWTKMDDNTPGLPNRWVSRIVIDEANSSRVSVSLMGYTPNNVWRTEDGGLNWTSITGTGALTLPNIPAAALAQHKVLPGRLYAGTDFGMFYTEDDGSTWETSSAGPGLAPVDELVWKDDRFLLAVTHGRGIYQADTSIAGVSDPVGPGCGVSGSPALSTNEPKIGAIVTFTIAGAAPAAPVRILLGFVPPSPTPLGGGCVAQVDPVSHLSIVAGSTSGSGSLVYNLPIPLDGFLVGPVLSAQAAILVAGGPLLGIGELTNGLSLQLGF